MTRGRSKVLMHPDDTEHRNEKGELHRDDDERGRRLGATYRVDAIHWSRPSTLHPLFLRLATAQELLEDDDG